MPSAARRVATCPECGSEFAVNAPHHTYCSDKCRWAYRERHDPSAIANNRTRCARWAAENRGVKQSNPWLLGAPPFEDYLPGGGVSIAFAPHITFEHRQLSALHGVITSLTGEHEPNTPRFSLVPMAGGCGWGAYLRHEDDARSLAGTRHRVRLGSGYPEIHFGPLVRLKSPRVEKRGHRKLRIDAITPVCVRCTNGQSGQYTMYTAPTGGNLRSTLETMTPRRIGLWVPDGQVKLDLVSRETQPSTLVLAGRSGGLGNMRGWVGHCIVDTNAVGHWLLEVSSRIGFGGRTAFGFGRVRVTSC